MDGTSAEDEDVDQTAGNVSMRTDGPVDGAVVEGGFTTQKEGTRAVRVGGLLEDWAGAVPQVFPGPSGNGRVDALNGAVDEVVEEVVEEELVLGENADVMGDPVCDGHAMLLGLGVGLNADTLRDS